VTPTVTRLIAIAGVGAFAYVSIWIIQRADRFRRSRLRWVLPEIMGVAAALSLAGLVTLARTSQADALLLGGLVAVLVATLVYMFILFARKERHSASARDRRPE
jgi:hypothetical protein